MQCLYYFNYVNIVHSRQWYDYFLYRNFVFFLVTNHLFFWLLLKYWCCCCSITKSRLTLCDLMDCSTLGFPILRYLPEFVQFMNIESVIPSNHLILCRPLLLCLSIFPSIRVFFNELALPMEWPKYWTFSMSPSNE